MTFKLDNKDCFEIFPSLKDNTFPLILTDPPYNLSNNTTGPIKFKQRKDFNRNIGDWDNKPLYIPFLAKQFERIVKSNGNVFVFCGYDQFGEWVNQFNQLFDRTQYMVWHKTNPAPSVRKTSFLKSSELIVCAWNVGHTWNFQNQVDMHNFFESPIVQGNHRFHPTQKPIALLEKIIKIASNEGDWVFDPFNGSGSAGKAALNLSRKYYGIERDKSFYDKSYIWLKRAFQNNYYCTKI